MGDIFQQFDKGSGASRKKENTYTFFIYYSRCVLYGLDAYAMDFDDTWAGPTEKLENKERKELSFSSHQNLRPSFPKSPPSLKKIQLLPLASDLPVSSLSELEFVPPVSPMTNIKLPPTILADLWGDSDTSSSEPDNAPLTSILNLSHTIKENRNIYVSEDTIVPSERKNKATIPLEPDNMPGGLWESDAPVSEEAREDWEEHVTTSFATPNIFEDLDLFDIDAALAKQETDVQQQEYEWKREITAREGRFERWGGVSSLIFVNWDNAETAEQDALRRLGYSDITLSKETRDFIIQAARNARLPHKQEAQLTTQLANARAQLAILPAYNAEEPIDLYSIRRRALQSEITGIEQTLACKMQWVAIKKAVQFLGQGIELDDLIQFGMLGVIAGIQHFDITRKARLLLAVNTWTFQALARAVADCGSAIRLPAYVFEQIKALKKQHLQWQLAHGCLPTRHELAEVMNISPTQLKAILKAEEFLRASKNVLSLEHYALAENANHGYSFQIPEVDFIANDDLFLDIFGEINGRQALHTLFQYLTPREQQVLSLRAGLDEGGGDEDIHTLEEIGKLLHVTRERVRQIEDRARKKLFVQLRKMSSIPCAIPKAEKREEAVRYDKIVQKQPELVKKPHSHLPSTYTPYITKKQVQEIKRKQKEQSEQEAEQR